VDGWEGTGQIVAAVVTNHENTYPLTLSPLPSRSPEAKRQVRAPRAQVMMEKIELNTRGGQQSRRKTDLKLKTCRPSPSFSYELLLGLAYCPAIRPMRTTGKRAPQIRTREKERMSPIFEEMFSCD
jgi:hypothetical protein